MTHEFDNKHRPNKKFASNTKVFLFNEEGRLSHNHGFNSSRFGIKRNKAKEKYQYLQGYASNDRIPQDLALVGQKVADRYAIP